jgi:hypothetical protein
MAERNYRYTKFYRNQLSTKIILKKNKKGKIENAELKKVKAK